MRAHSQNLELYSFYYLFTIQQGSRLKLPVIFITDCFKAMLLLWFNIVIVLFVCFSILLFVCFSILLFVCFSIVLFVCFSI